MSELEAKSSCRFIELLDHDSELALQLSGSVAERRRTVGVAPRIDS